MPRPSRTWVRKTYTVSPEVNKAIAARAAEQDIDPGTVMDVIVWNAILKPDEARLKIGGFTNDELERVFAEEVLALLKDDAATSNLGESYTPIVEDQLSNLRLIRTLVKGWRRTRQIEKDHQEGVFAWLTEMGIVPSILLHGCVDLGWFQPK